MFRLRLRLYVWLFCHPKVLGFDRTGKVLDMLTAKHKRTIDLNDDRLSFGLEKD